MSENKCPCCGCPMKETYLGFVCPTDNCAFRCSTNSLPLVAAAMDLARASKEYDNSNLHKIMGAGARLNAAFERVLEVFNAK